MQPDFQESSPLPSGTSSIAPHHADLLLKGGITPGTAADYGVRSVLTDAELPQALQEFHYAQTPGILFTWNSPTHGEVPQFRPDNPLPRKDDPEKTAKYVFPIGAPSVLNELRPQGGTLLLVEGTKQSLAAASYAPIDTAVYGMMGCYGWSDDGMPNADMQRGIAEGKKVIVVLDGDVASNIDVYRAGLGLAKALKADGAKWVRFMRLPVSKSSTNGLDDLLGRVPEDRRLAYLSHLIRDVADEKLKARDVERLEKPADKEPKPTKDSTATGVNSELEMVDATDLDVADAFVKLHGHQVLYNRTTDRFLTYHDGLWDGEGGLALTKALYLDMIRGEIMAVREDKDGNILEQREWLFSAPTMGHILNVLSGKRQIQIRAQDLDPDPWLWNAKNCIINLRDGQPAGHDPNLLMTQQSDVVYDPDAEAPEFTRFIEWALPDPTVRAYVQRIFGLSLVGKPVKHIFPVFTGDGRNGKGTLIRLALAVFGSYGTGIKDDVLVETRYESHATKLATFFKKRLAATDELPAHSKWDVALVKKLTGGDAITANYMRQDDFTFEASHMLVLSTNHKPHVGENEYAFWRRYREIPFTQTLSDDEIDSDLEDRIKANEMSGILNWMIDGLLDYHAEGLPTPEAVEEASRSTERTNSVLYPFTSSVFERTGAMTDVVTGKEVADSYKKWLSENKGATQLGGAKFHQEFCTLLGLDYKSKEKSKDAGLGRWGDTSKTRLYKTIRFKGDDDLTESEDEGDAAPSAAHGAAVAAPRAAHDDDQARRVSPAQGTVAAHAAHAAPISAGGRTHEGSEGGVADQDPQDVDKGGTSAACAASTAPEPGGVEFPQVTVSSVTAADWTALLALDAAEVPQTPCRVCGTTEVPDDEIGVFRLCPVCTSATLRTSTR